MHSREHLYAKKERLPCDGDTFTRLMDEKPPETDDVVLNRVCWFVGGYLGALLVLAFLLFLWLTGPAQGAPRPAQRAPRPAPARVDVTRPVLYQHYRWTAYPAWTVYLCHGNRFVCFGPMGVQEGFWNLVGNSHLMMRCLRPDPGPDEDPLIWRWDCGLDEWQKHLEPDYLLFTR